MLVMAFGLRGVYYYCTSVNPMFLSLIYFPLFTQITGFSLVIIVSSAFLLKFLHASFPHCPYPLSIFLPHPSYFFLISHEVSLILRFLQPAISLSYLPLLFFPSLELFPHILNSFFGFSHNFSPQFVSLSTFRLSR